MPVAIQFDPNVFDTGKPLAAFAGKKHKARYIMNSGVESAPHIAHGAWFANRDYPEPPNSITICVHWGGPSWFDTPAEFNLLPYAEVRAQIANEVERGVLQVLTSAGAIATVANIRSGNVT